MLVGYQTGGGDGKERARSLVQPNEAERGKRATEKGEIIQTR